MCVACGAPASAQDASDTAVKQAIVDVDHKVETLAKKVQELQHVTQGQQAIITHLERSRFELMMECECAMMERDLARIKSELDSTCVVRGRFGLRTKVVSSVTPDRRKVLIAQKTKLEQRLEGLTRAKQAVKTAASR